MKCAAEITKMKDKASKKISKIVSENAAHGLSLDMPKTFAGVSEIVESVAGSTHGDQVFQALFADFGNLLRKRISGDTLSTDEADAAKSSIASGCGRLKQLASFSRTPSASMVAVKVCASLSVLVANKDRVLRLACEKTFTGGDVKVVHACERAREEIASLQKEDLVAATEKLLGSASATEAITTAIKGMLRAVSDLKKSFFNVLLGSCKPAMRTVQKELVLMKCPCTTRLMCCTQTELTIKKTKV